jgi:periplasmic copper chaperone A
MNMTPRSPARRLVLLTLALILSATAAAVAQRKVASISSGWVKLPAAGATQAEAFLVIDNPTAYDVSLQKPSSDTAGVVEIREAGKPAALDFLSVPAYGGLEMTGKTTYLLLRDLKQPLSEGAMVPISVMTDSGAPLTVQAVVKKE